MRHTEDGSQYRGVYPAEIVMDSEAKLIFPMLTWPFSEWPNIKLFKQSNLIILQADSSHMAIADRFDNYEGWWITGQVNFEFCECSRDKHNCHMYYQESMHTANSLRQWHHSLEGVLCIIIIQCNQQNLNFITTWNMFTLRQAQWAVIPCYYVSIIEQLTGMKNQVDWPLGRCDSENGVERIMARLLATSAVTGMIDYYEDLLPGMVEAHESDL